MTPPLRLFITGVSGLVGGNLARLALAAGHHVTGTVGAFTGELAPLHTRLTLNLADAAALTTALRAARPDVILNCAALSQPAECDKNPALSHALNVTLPETLARISGEFGARLIHLSSEQVFSGAQTQPYTPDDTVSPINLYGRQKVESEQRVHLLAPRLAVTLRAPLLMGNSPGQRRSLHERLLADWAAGRTARLFTDEFRQTCTAENLAAAMLELATTLREITGVHHWAGAELLSRHEHGLRIRAHFGLSETSAPIAPVRLTDNPALAATRQPCLALDCSSLIRHLRTQPEKFSQQLTQLFTLKATS